jgi:hypothetical protein
MKFVLPAEATMSILSMKEHSKGSKKLQLKKQLNYFRQYEKRNYPRKNF